MNLHFHKLPSDLLRFQCIDNFWDSIVNYNFNTENVKHEIIMNESKMRCYSFYFLNWNVLGYIDNYIFIIYLSLCSQKRLLKVKYHHHDFKIYLRWCNELKLKLERCCTLKNVMQLKMRYLYPDFINIEQIRNSIITFVDVIIKNYQNSLFSQSKYYINFII